MFVDGGKKKSPWKHLLQLASFIKSVNFQELLWILLEALSICYAILSLKFY